MTDHDYHSIADAIADVLYSKFDLEIVRRDNGKPVTAALALRLALRDVAETFTAIDKDVNAIILEGARSAAAECGITIEEGQ